MESGLGDRLNGEGSNEGYDNDIRVEAEETDERTVQYDLVDRSSNKGYDNDNRSE